MTTMTHAEMCTLNELRNELVKRAKATQTPMVLLTGFTEDFPVEENRTIYNRTIFGDVEVAERCGIGAACGRPSDIYELVISAMDQYPGGLQRLEKCIVAWKVMRTENN